MPQPQIDYIEQLKQKPEVQPQNSPTKSVKTSPSKPSKPRQDSFGGDPTSDPWASPAPRQDTPRATGSSTTQSNGLSSSAMRTTNGVPRTTSGFTTRGDGSDPPRSSPTESRIGSSAGGGWGSYNGSSGGFSDQPTLGGGFGDSGDGQSNQPDRNSQLPVTASITIPPGTGEMVTVTMLPEKEGSFLFQHNNYEVKTLRRGSTVIRRYSDFVWLLDCLQKRYPFRRLPLLPPKRVQGKILYFPS